MIVAVELHAPVHKRREELSILAMTSRHNSRTDDLRRFKEVEDPCG